MFSNRNREEIARTISQITYDVIIIGGGLTGASLLYDLQSRGMKGLLIDKHDFATSKRAQVDHLLLESKSTKEKKEQLVESDYLARQFKDGFAAVPVYVIGDSKKETADFRPSFVQVIKQKQTFNKKNNLAKDAVKQMIHLDATCEVREHTLFIADRVRMVIELLKKSRALGAHITNYHKVTEFHQHQGRIAGVFLEDQMTGEHFKVHAKRVINATGTDLNLYSYSNRDASTPSRPEKIQIQAYVKKESFEIDQALFFKSIKEGFDLTVSNQNNRVLIDAALAFDQVEVLGFSSSESKAWLTQQINARFLDISLNETDLTNVQIIKYKERNDYEQLKTALEKEKITGLINTRSFPLLKARKLAAQLIDELVLLFKKDEGILFQQSETHLVKPPVESNGEWLTTEDAQCLQHIIRKYQISQDIYQKLITCIERVQPHVSLSRPFLFELFYAIDYEGIYKPLDFMKRRLRHPMDDYHWDLSKLSDLIGILEKYLSYTKEECSYYEREARLFLDKLNHLQ